MARRRKRKQHARAPKRAKNARRAKRPRRARPRKAERFRSLAIEDLPLTEFLP